MSTTQVKINVPGNHLMGPLLGHRDELLRLVEAAFPDTGIHVRGNEIAIDGAAAEQVGKVFEELVLLLQQGHPLEPAVLGRTIEMVRADERPSEVLTTEVLRSGRGRSVRPKSSGQKRYVDAIRDNVITFGIGPAGTGKSWLAVAMAVQALQAKEVERIILTRPAVEAGERLGFLPGDLMAKVDPYLRPLYDALYDMVEPEGAQRLLERGTVEVAPLAFMRGRRLRATAHWSEARTRSQSGDDAAAGARARGDDVGDEVRAARVPVQPTDVRLAVLQGLLDSDGGPVTQAKPELPHPVQDVLATAARRCRVPGAVAGGCRLQPDAGGCGPRTRTGKGSRGPPPPRLAHARHPPAGRHPALPAHAQGGQVPRCTAPGVRCDTSRRSSRR